MKTKLLVSLFGLFEPIKLDYINLREAKTDTKFLGEFFLFYIILLALTRFFFN